MVLWHLGTAAALTYVTIGRRRVDYRFVLLGAVAPDAVDAVLGALFFEGSSGRFVAHSLAAPIAIGIAVIVALRGDTRLAAFGLPVGWLLHLVGDGMWAAPQTFLWPAFGATFATTPAEPYGWHLFTEPLTHAWTWAGEAVGAALLAWFWVAFRLGVGDRGRRFLSDGRLRA